MICIDSIEIRWLELEEYLFTAEAASLIVSEIFRDFEDFRVTTEESPMTKRLNLKLGPKGCYLKIGDLSSEMIGDCKAYKTIGQTPREIIERLYTKIIVNRGFNIR